MKKKVHTTKFLALIIASALFFVMMSTVCRAQEWSRKGKGEFYVFGQSMGGDTATGLGVTIKLDDNIAGGLGAGTNLSDNFNLNTSLFYGSKDITGTVSAVTLKGDTTLFGWDVNVDYNILKGRITPMITGGIGFIAFNGDWKGTADFQETDFSYNIGGGLRWDVTNNFLIKAIYKATWTKLEDTDEAIRFDGINLSIGYIF